MKTVKELFEDSMFDTFLQRKIDVFNKINVPHKRTAFDSLKDKGLLEVERFRKEFTLVVDKESTLPAAEREAIEELAKDVIRDVYDYREKEEAKVQEVEI